MENHELDELARMLAEERARSRGLQAELNRALTVIADLEPKLQEAQRYGKHICDHRLAELKMAYEDEQILSLLFGEPGHYFQSRPISEAIVKIENGLKLLNELQDMLGKVAGSRNARSSEERFSLHTQPTENIDEWAMTRHAAIDTFVVKVRKLTTD